MDEHEKREIPYEHPATTGDESESSIPGPVTEQDEPQSEPAPEARPEPDHDDIAEEARRAVDASAASEHERTAEAGPGTSVPEATENRAAVLAASRQHTRRAFAVAAVGAVAGYSFWRWTQVNPVAEDQPVPIRTAFQTNAAIARGVFRDRGLAPTYPLSRAENLRVNGIFGLKKELVLESWRMQVVGSRFGAGHPRYATDVTAWEYRFKQPAGAVDQGHDTKTRPREPGSQPGAPAAIPEAMDTAEKMAPEPHLAEQRARERGTEEAGHSHSTLEPGTPGLLLTMDDILKLPRHELVTQFKCIEGWSQIVHWAGVRLADFLEAYPPAPINGAEPKYVYMETPNGDYYTGYDMDVCRHPQALLVTEMMGAPLTQTHGAPLRLHMPNKYGYKQIKSIGLIRYMNDRPDDYWTKLGYDWYAGL